MPMGAWSNKMAGTPTGDVHGGVRGRTWVPMEASNKIWPVHLRGCGRLGMSRGREGEDLGPWGMV